MEKSDKFVLFLLGAGVLALLVWIMRSATDNAIPQEPLSGYGMTVGDVPPKIRAEGWINGEAPSAESLEGQVVVVDAWAYWCQACMRDAPDLVAAYEKYHPQGVVFIGLTSEGADKLNETRQFAQAAGFSWPSGYGAIETLIAFGSDYFPAAWVIGRDGKVVWNRGMRYVEPLDEAIARALAAPLPEEDSAAAENETSQPADTGTASHANSAETAE